MIQTNLLLPRGNCSLDIASDPVLYLVNAASQRGPTDSRNECYVRNGKHERASRVPVVSERYEWSHEWRKIDE